MLTMVTPYRCDDPWSQGLVLGGSNELKTVSKVGSSCQWKWFIHWLSFSFQSNHSQLTNINLPILASFWILCQYFSCPDVNWMIFDKLPRLCHLYFRISLDVHAMWPHESRFTQLAKRHGNASEIHGTDHDYVWLPQRQRTPNHQTHGFQTFPAWTVL